MSSLGLFLLSKIEIGIIALFQELLQCCKFPKVERLMKSWNAQEKKHLITKLGQPKYPSFIFLFLWPPPHRPVLYHKPVPQRTILSVLNSLAAYPVSHGRCFGRQ